MQDAELNAVMTAADLDQNGEAVPSTCLEQGFCKGLGSPVKAEKPKHADHKPMVLRVTGLPAKMPSQLCRRNRLRGVHCLYSPSQPAGAGVCLPHSIFSF